ncbi:MAG: OmpA family protein [Bacteroidetes bacterium]|nr:OmpA family protein [Bacteroidota bacterium]
MQKLVLAGMLLLFAGRSFGSPDTLRLYFAIDVYQLSGQDKLKIKGVADSATKDRPVTIRGYADYLGNKRYNQALSERRANEVRTYILSLGIKISLNTEGKGQIDEPGEKSALGEPHDRRVDIIYNRKIAVAKNPLDQAMIKFTKKVDSLSSLDVGKSISLDELTFEGGRHILDSGSHRYLLLLTRYLAEHKTLYFEVRGHVCCEPPDSDGYDYDTHDYRLSINRAKAIYQYFIQNGIDTARMRYTGVGASRPKVYPEVTEADKQRNRRVEIIILRK